MNQSNYNFAKNPTFNLEKYLEYSSFDTSSLQGAVEYKIAEDLLSRLDRPKVEIWCWCGLDDFLDNPKRWKLLFLGNDLYEVKNIARCYQLNNPNLTLIVLQTKNLTTNGIYHPYFGEHILRGVFGKLDLKACWTKDLEKRYCEQNE